MKKYVIYCYLYFCTVFIFFCQEKPCLFSTLNFLATSSVMIPHYMVAVSQQHYETDIFRENVILGNEGIFKCSIPSFLADFVSVVAWEDSEANIWHYGPSNFGNWWKYDANGAVKNAAR